MNAAFEGGGGWHSAVAFQRPLSDESAERALGKAVWLVRLSEKLVRSYSRTTHVGVK